MTRQGALALALVLAAPAVGAVSLGEVQVRSFLGDKLDARIAVSPAAGESIRGACFSLSPDGTPGVPRLIDGELTLQRSASGTYLRIRSSAPLQDPALGLGIVIACPGEEPQGTQEFSVLLDPRTSASAPTVEARRAPPPAVSARLGTREGDTLESIAAAIFPNDRAARASYLAALREANAPLAARGDREPIPAKETVALPDLRTFMQQRQGRIEAAAVPSGAGPSSSEELAAMAAAPVPRRAAPPKTAAEPSTPRAASPAPKGAAPENAVAAPSPASRGRPVPGFQLKLSGAEVDLTRSSAIDDRSRAQLRERLLMLDADDQVAAMLSMRNSLKQLEARVAELQLKLAGMPPSLAGKGEGAPAAKTPAKAEPAPPAPVVATTPKPPEPKPVEPPKIELPVPAVAPKVEAPPPKAAPTVETPPTAVATKPEAPPAAKAEVAKPTEPAKPRVVPKPAFATGSTLPNWLWAVVALLAVLALLLAWYLLRRRRATEDEYYSEDALPPLEPLDEIAPESTPDYAAEQDAEVTYEEAPRERRVVASDADLATRIPENSADLRRRYIEERFPEITTRMIVLDDADSVVKGARLFYEDGALPRAVELLQFAIEAHPEAVKCWLALFEIFRLERLTGEFAALAHRFKQQHGESEHWRKVQFFGREIDPGNALYQEPMNTLETIGPREARRLAAAARFDPIAENWLNAPMDFENEVLANELRMVLMQHAGLAEEDLLPNPMPALRNVEMFTVA